MMMVEVLLPGCSGNETLSVSDDLKDMGMTPEARFKLTLNDIHGQTIRDELSVMGSPLSSSERIFGCDIIGWKIFKDDGSG
jgi:hypothetical protein